jgi:hypothetical protein
MGVDSGIGQDGRVGVDMSRLGTRTGIGRVVDGSRLRTRTGW